MTWGPFGDLLWGLRPLHSLLHVLRPVTPRNLVCVLEMSAPHLRTFGAEKTFLLFFTFPETKKLQIKKTTKSNGKYTIYIYKRLKRNFAESR